MVWSEIGQATWPLVGVIIGAAISPAVQVYLQKHKQTDWIDQQWWQRKADMYTQVVEMMSARLVQAEEYQDYIYNPSGTLSEEYLKAEESRLEDLNRLRHLANVGAFVISPEVARTIASYLADYHRILDMIDTSDQINADITATKKCLEAVRKAALADLKLKHRP